MNALAEAKRILDAPAAHMILSNPEWRKLTAELVKLIESPCGMDDGTFDHDWHYDGGDPDVGQASAWVCRTCGEEDCNREPPSDDDYC